MDKDWNKYIKVEKNRNNYMHELANCIYCSVDDWDVCIKDTGTLVIEPSEDIDQDIEKLGKIKVYIGVNDDELVLSSRWDKLNTTILLASPVDVSRKILKTVDRFVESSYFQRHEALPLLDDDDFDDGWDY